MDKVTSFLSGSKLLEHLESPVNGEISVITDLTWGPHIQADGLTQSGGVAETVWKTTLEKVRLQKPTAKNILILGLGGGSIAKLARKYWGNNPKIVGVEIDPLMVDLGKKYLKLDDYSVDIKIEDAEKYLSKTKNKSTSASDGFDLICVDIYVGSSVPQKFESPVFARKVQKLLVKDGIAVFNRLYYDEKRKIATKFGLDLEKVYKTVTPVFPEANIMFICT